MLRARLPAVVIPAGVRAKLYSYWRGSLSATAVHHGSQDAQQGISPGRLPLEVGAQSSQQAGPFRAGGNSATPIAKAAPFRFTAAGASPVRQRANEWDARGFVQGRRRCACAWLHHQSITASQLQPKPPVCLSSTGRSSLTPPTAAGHRPAPAGNVIGQGLDQRQDLGITEGGRRHLGSAANGSPDRKPAGRAEWPTAREALTIDAGRKTEPVTGLGSAASDCQEVAAQASIRAGRPGVNGAAFAIEELHCHSVQHRRRNAFATGLAGSLVPLLQLLPLKLSSAVAPIPRDVARPHRKNPAA